MSGTILTYLKSLTEKNVSNDIRSYLPCITISSGNSSSTSSASANGSASNGASTAGGGVKIADNQLHQLQQHHLQQQSSSDFPSVNNMHPQQHLKPHPEVPMRANGGTATIRLVHHVHPA